MDTKLLYPQKEITRIVGIVCDIEANKESLQPSLKGLVVGKHKCLCIGLTQEPHKR